MADQGGSMPSSRFDVIPIVLKHVVDIKPKTILDIGIGYGKWGVLFREYLDIWDVDKPYDERGLHLTGIEANADYDNSVWQTYDDIIVCNVMSKLEHLKKIEVDLLFMGDVIEHFSKGEGKLLLNTLKYKNAIIVTPLVVSAQEAVYDNPYEIHKSSWSKADFPELKQHYLINNQQVFIL